MIYNTVMVHLSIDGGAAQQLKFARDLATRFESSLIGFAAGDVHPVKPPPPGVIMDDEFMRLEAKEIERRFEALRSDLEANGETGSTDSLRTTIGDPVQGLATAARAADLVIAGPGLDNLGELIHAAGRPVLIPRGDLEPLRANNVVVAWADAREARRAVADAMPFLVHAREVLVATIEERDRDRAVESATDVVRYLINHGARARSEVFSHGGAADGETLAEIAKQVGADLVVSGAYGHSKLREWLMGGVTRSLLRQGSLNRLMSY
ncbi:universal stress protein [Sinorhizobium fredii]|uniref:universal stress protein n=1 Tax=Rhizobium fredii TaxID=380 RepID=UPI0035167619